MQKHILTVLATALFAVAAGAQTYVWSPRGADTNPGGTNNTIPFWGQSATYQQIHDGPDFQLPVLIIKGMGIRNAGSRTTRGRTWDLHIQMSTTSVKANSASGTFATNLGTNNVTSVFGTAAQFAKFTWQDATSTSNTSPPAFTIPFTTPYTYIKAAGNLCWEWRHMNATLNTTMPMDATAGTSHKGTVNSSVGTGCTVKGNTAPATAAITIGTARPTLYQVSLSNAATNQNALMALGLTAKTTPIPGWCANLELVPAVVLPAQTNAQGNFSLSAPLSLLQGTSQFTLLTQFAFNDPSHASGLGLSNMVSYTTPVLPGSHGMCRVYKSTFGGTTNADATATSGSTTLSYGLCVAWLQ